MNVITQSVKELRAVGLRINRVHANMLPKHAVLGTSGLRIDVYAFVRLPDAGEPAQWPEIGKVVRSNPRLGEDIGGNGQHGISSDVIRSRARRSSVA